MKRVKTIRCDSRILSSWLLVMLLVLVSVYLGFAQSTEQPTEAQQAKFGGPDTVPNRIKLERVDKDTLYEFEFMKPYYDWKDRILEKYGIFGVDLDGKVAFINPAAKRMLGCGPDELIGHDVHEKIHHSHADGSAYPKSECPMYLTHADGTDHHIADEVLWRKDGTSFPVQYTSMPIKKNGQVVGAVVTFMDITDRKKMEAALRENQKRVMQAAEISMFGFWEVDLNSQEYAMTDSLWKLFGTTAEKEGGYAIWKAWSSSYRRPWTTSPM